MEKVIGKFSKGNLKGKVIYLVLTSARKIRVMPEISRELMANGASVWIFPTEKAQKMMGELDFGDAKIVNDFDWKGQGPSIPEEDYLIVVPCTFNTLNKIRFGIADNYPTTMIATSIAKKKKVFVAPAFNEMWYHPITIESIDTLSSWGVKIIWPEIGEDKVTMIDAGKILDSVYAENHKIIFDSEQIYSIDLSKELTEVRNKYLSIFNKIGIEQHKEAINSKTHGCSSVRIDKDWMLITSSGSKTNELLPEDLTMVKISDDLIVRWVGDKLPSSETPMHIAFYINSDVEAVVHSHSYVITYSPKFSNLNTPSYVRYGRYHAAIPVVEQSKQQGGFVIMKFHGEVGSGKNLAEAASKIKGKFDCLKS